MDIASEPEHRICVPTDIHPWAFEVGYEDGALQSVRQYLKHSPEAVLRSLCIGNPQRSFSCKSVRGVVGFENRVLNEKMKPEQL